ncbi:MAG: DUF1501 domain-containing protein [Planctomycetales bacterium]|nr:DUF1501 domain-containing protein [Planctomycetales bacterium]
MTACQVDQRVNTAIDLPSQQTAPPRRRFLKRCIGSVAALTCSDFLSYFAAYGMPAESKSERMAADATEASEDPHFLIYWYLEGGWCGYDMFNPVNTENNVVHRLDEISQERYRVLPWGNDDYHIKTRGNIRYGYLAEPGSELFSDMAVLSSMHTGSGHSRDRLKVHMGDYSFKQTEPREDDERSVMQAFSEVYGQPYVLPHLSWHWWLSDGELNETQYTGRRGYYHALGPVHAHTVYAGTPKKLRSLLLQLHESSGDAVNAQVDKFLSDAHQEILNDDNIQAVRSYHSARDIYLQLNQKGKNLDRTALVNLFSDPILREDFGVTAADELITYRSVNGNKARSKFSPNTNVQAMMALELLAQGLSCGFFIESRDVRRFDSHNSRKNLWRGKGNQPVGNPDQSEMMKQDLWTPLTTLVRHLKNTEYKNSETSLFDHTNIVITSEFGRSIHGDVQGILEKKISEEKKQAEIGGQDISAHWQVTSCAFLGGNVKGDSQYGRVGEATLMAIPILPDGSLDPAYNPITGQLNPEQAKSPHSFIPNHGDVYATALELSGVSPAGRGRNERPALPFIKRS